MNDSFLSSDPLLDSLLAKARASRPDTVRAEFAFETRLLARLRAAQAPARFETGRLAWKLAPFFAVVVLGLGLLQVETGRASQEAEQAASLQNPEAVDLFATMQ